MMTYYLGIDIGGTAIKYGIGNPGEELRLASSIPTPQTGLKEFLHVTRKLIHELMDQNPDIAGIGIATPGTIDRKSGMLLGVNPNLRWWIRKSPLDIVPDEFRKIAVCDNDANLMTLAEAQSTLGVVLGITVGTGIGSGLVLNGRIYHGSQGFALEAGHMCVQRDGLKCSCGLSGCLEAYSSVSAIRKAARQIDPKYASCGLDELLQDARRTPGLQTIIKRGRDFLSMGLANLAMLLDPDVIVIGGGAMEAGLYDIDQIAMTIAANTAKVNHHTAIQKAKTGNLAGVIGAILLAAQE